MGTRRRRRRTTADERALAVARLAYREGLSDEEIRRTAIYADIRKAQRAELERRKRLRQEREEIKARRPE